MLIEIFEADGYSLPTDIDMLLINLKRKYTEELGLRKIPIEKKEEISKHKDVVQVLAHDGLDALPIVKLDGKIIQPDKLQDLLYKKLR